MKTKLYTFLLSSLLCTGALADNEPWQNPQINEMNREPMHAHFTPFTNEANALKQVVLFIAKCTGGEIKAQECEVNDIKWLDLQVKQRKISTHLLNL